MASPEPGGQVAPPGNTSWLRMRSSDSFSSTDVIKASDFGELAADTKMKVSFNFGTVETSTLKVMQERGELRRAYSGAVIDDPTGLVRSRVVNEGHKHGLVQVFRMQAANGGQDLKIITRTPEGLIALTEFANGVMRWLRKPRDPVSLYVSEIEPLTVYDLSDIFSSYGNVTNIRVLSDINKEDVDPIYGHAAIITLAPKSEQRGSVDIPTRIPVQSRMGDNCIMHVSMYSGGQRFGNLRRLSSTPSHRIIAQELSVTPSSPASVPRNANVQALVSGFNISQLSDSNDGSNQISPGNTRITASNDAANNDSGNDDAALASSNFNPLIEAASSGTVDGMSVNGSSSSTQRLSDTPPAANNNTSSASGSAPLVPSNFNPLVEAAISGTVDGTDDAATVGSGSSARVNGTSTVNTDQVTNDGNIGSATMEASNSNLSQSLSCFGHCMSIFPRNVFSLRYALGPLLPQSYQFVGSEFKKKWSKEMKYAYQQYEKFDDIYRKDPTAVISLRPVLKSFSGKKKDCLTCGTPCKKKLVKWEFLGVIYDTAFFCSDKCMLVPLLVDPYVALSPLQFLMLFGGTPEEYALIHGPAHKQWRESKSEWCAFALPGLTTCLGSTYEGFRSLSSSRPLD